MLEKPSELTSQEKPNPYDSVVSGVKQKKITRYLLYMGSNNPIKGLIMGDWGHFALINGVIPSLKLTFSHLKQDAWNTCLLRFGLFSGANC